ncbi:MAG: TolC family protein [Lysobacterales bacterium]
MEHWVRARRRARFGPSVVGAMALLVALSGYAETPESAVAPPTVAAAVRDVWARNPAVQAAEARVAAAEAQAQGASRPLYNPELELSAENADVDTRSIGLSQQIDWSGKRRARTTVAQAELAVAEADRDDVRQRIALDWLRGYAAYQVASEQVTLGQERVELLTQFASLAQRRLRAGDIPSLERDLAELALQEARAQQAELVADQAKARQTLTGVGGRPGSLPVLPRAVPPAAVPKPEKLTDLPAIRRARAEVDASQGRVSVAERERRPDPTISVSTGRVTDGPLNDRLIGVTVRVPLFVRNSYRAEATAARSTADAAESAFNDVQLRATAEVEQAAESYSALREAWLGWESSHAASAGDRAALLQRLWEAGELSTADYLVQLKQSLDTELTAVGVRARVWQAWADWLAASGELASWLGLDADAAPTSKEIHR